MNIKTFKDSSSLANAASGTIAHYLLTNPNPVLGLATGNSPIASYQALVRLYQSGALSFKGVRTFNLDEYIACPHQEETFRYFMDSHLFDLVDIKKENTHFPDPVDPLSYDRLIAANGGIGLQLLGVGQNGHIGFNEPGTPFDSGSGIIRLSDSTKRANAPAFGGDPKAVPDEAVTMGIGTIGKSRSIILVADTLSKAEAIASLLRGVKDISYPCTSLLTHPDFTLFLTEDLLEAAKKLVS